VLDAVSGDSNKELIATGPYNAEEGQQFYRENPEFTKGKHFQFGDQDVRTQHYGEQAPN